jgi:hypothetical protein
VTPLLRIPTLNFPNHLLVCHRNCFIATTMSLKRKAADAATEASKKTKQNSITSFFGAPKPKADAPAATFDKDAWVSKLTDEQKELLKLEIDTLHESWLPHLKDVLLSPNFLELKRFLKKELASGKTLYPPMQDVYSWYVSTHTNCAHFARTIADTMQVASHAPQHRQGSHHRSGSLPRPQPGPRPLLLRAPADTRPALAQEHIHRPQERLPRLSGAAQKRGPADTVGGPRRADDQHGSHSAPIRGELAQGQGLGASDSEGD